MRVRTILFAAVVVVLLCGPLAAETPTAVLNRLTKLTFRFESTVPVAPDPVFVVPPDARVVSSTLTTEPGERLLHEFVLDMFFESPGSYTIGPFVFRDRNGGSISVPPTTVEAVAAETIGLPKTGSRSADLPPKFYTFKPLPKLYPGSPLFFILEIPDSYEQVSVQWPGWENVFTEKTEELSKKNGANELRFMVVFPAAGSYTLAPIKFKLNRGKKEFPFSSSPLSVQVTPLPPHERELRAHTGSYTVSVTPYAGTSRDRVQVDVIFTGRGFLSTLPPPELTVTPAVDMLLRKKTVSYLAQYPEPQGKAEFRYFFTPPADGEYRISLKPALFFDPARSVFSNTSGTHSAVQVHLPSNPSSTPADAEFQKKLAIRKKPDYEFYALITFALLVTLFAIALWIKGLVGGHREKKPAAPPVHTPEDPLLTVQRAVLVYLQHFTGEDLLTAPLSRIKTSVTASSLSGPTRERLFTWLDEIFKLRYLKERSGMREGQLRQRGLELLQTLKEEKAAMLQAATEKKSHD